MGPGISTSHIGRRYWPELPAWARWGVVATVNTAVAAFLTLTGYTASWLPAERDLQALRLKHLAAEKALVEAELRMLQAQVEPHFLFHTLALLRSSITSDVERGQQLMDHLTNYRRASLFHRRRSHATLGQERLNALYGPQGRLQVEGNPQGGVTVRLAVPLS